MSWKPPRRALQNVQKLKLDHPLPENVEEVTSVNDNLMISGQKSIQRPRNDPFLIPDNVSNLSDNSCNVEKNYFDKFEEITGLDHGDEGDLDRILFSDFGDTGGSTWDDSSASFLSWADGIEDAEAAKTKALFDDVERLIYGEESNVKNDELMNECIAWTESHISLRVFGKRSEFVAGRPDSSLSQNANSDLEEEIFAINNYSEKPLVIEESNGECGDSVATPRRAVSGGLFDKVKKAALEQLTIYALSEAVKSFQQEDQASKLFHREESTSSSDRVISSTASSIPTSRSCGLIVSGKSLQRTPSVLLPELERKAHFPARSLSRALNIDLPNSSAKVDSTNFLSSASRRKAGLWNRRFSCFTTEHSRVERWQVGDENDITRNSSGSVRGNVNMKQISVPNTPLNTPLKFLKHLSLPPIQNFSCTNKLPPRLQLANQHSLSHIRQIFVKNKVALSPLPAAMSTPINDTSDLQLAKSLLESTPDASKWNSCRKVGISGSQNLRTRKKSRDKSLNEI